jgi:hypothetical protein
MLVRTDETISKLLPFEVVERTRATESAAIRQHEASDEASLPKNALVCDNPRAELQHLGSAMTHTTFMNRVRRINDRIHFEVSLKDNRIWGVYLTFPYPIRADGECRQFISRMEPGIMPEFQMFKGTYVNRPDPDIKGHSRRVPTVDDIIVGWRTILARLHKARALTEPQITRAFGVPSTDSERWQYALST